MKLLLLKAGDRQDLSIYELRNEIKKQLDQQWQRLEMFSKSINEVIPYLPLEPIHIQQIFLQKFHQFQRRFQLKKWLAVILEEDVLLELTSSQYIGYNLTTVSFPGQRKQESSSSIPQKITKRFARHGARSLEKGNSIFIFSFFLSTYMFESTGRSIGGPLQDLQSLLFSYQDPGIAWCLSDFSSL